MQWVTCECGKKFEVYGGENKACPSCGRAAKNTASNWIKCPHCLTKVEVRRGEAKACPSCRRTISG